MYTLVLLASGWLAFVIGTAALGTRFRRQPSKDGTERMSGVLLFLVGADLSTLGFAQAIVR